MNMLFKSPLQWISISCCALLICVRVRWQVLSDPEQRLVYDEINGYALTSANPFLNSKQERDHCFVDEFTCIGKSSSLDIIASLVWIDGLSWN